MNEERVEKKDKLRKLVKSKLSLLLGKSRSKS